MADKTIIQKLSEIRKEVQGFVKDTEGYNYQYFDINQMVEKIQPIVEKQGLLLTQPITVENGVNVMSIVIHDIENEGEETLAKIILPTKEDPQKMGSLITYYRRYLLQTTLFWGAVDDDGKEAAKPEKASSEQVQELNDLIVRHSVDQAALLTHYKVHTIEDMSENVARTAIKQLRAKYE